MQGEVGILGEQFNGTGRVSIALGLKQANPVSVFWRSAVLGNGHTFPGLISSANPTRITLETDS